MVKLLNRVKMTVSGTPGTGNITVNAAESGFLSFAQAGGADTDVVRYGIEDGTSFEIGTAVLSSSATVLTRTVQQSSNSNNALDLTSSAIVFATSAAADIVQPATSPSLADLTLTGGLYVGGSGAANYLDNIEEGDIAANSLSYTGFSNVTVQSAKYIKINNFVTVNMYLTGYSRASSNAQITGLPFTCLSGTRGAVTIYTNATETISGSSVTTNLFGYVGSGTNIIYFRNNSVTAYATRFGTGTVLNVGYYTA